MHYAIDFGDDLATITTSGDADVESFVRLNAEFVNHPRFRRGMSILVDHSDLGVTKLAHGQVRTIGEEFGRIAGSIGPSRLAVVAPGSLTFARTRQSELYAGPVEAEVRVFHSRADALAWLGTGDANDA